MKEIDRLEEACINEVFNKTVKTLEVEENMDKYVRHIVKMYRKEPRVLRNLRYIQLGIQ